MFKSLLFKVALNNTQIQMIYNEPSFNYTPIPDNIKTIRGYFQSSKYFHHNRDNIIELLGFNHFKKRFKFDFKTVAIHLRFGDMSFNQVHHVIQRPEYYIDALKVLLNKIDKNDYKFIIFGEKNDDEIINDYMNIFSNIFNIKFFKFYDIHRNVQDWQEMFYMSSCEHFIISNSTFSWFSAYLSNNPEKTVIYPSRWFGNNYTDKTVDDLFLEDWIKI
jgi:hypothetical protein